MTSVKRKKKKENPLNSYLTNANRVRPSIYLKPNIIIDYKINRIKITLYKLLEAFNN